MSNPLPLKKPYYHFAEAAAVIFVDHRPQSKSTNEIIIPSTATNENGTYPAVKAEDTNNNIKEECCSSNNNNKVNNNNNSNTNKLCEPMHPDMIAKIAKNCNYFTSEYFY